MLKLKALTPRGCVKKKCVIDYISGGLQITAYTVERKELDRDLWISCGKLTGKTVQVMKFLEMDVSDLLPFGVYMFRVCGVNAQVWPPKSILFLVSLWLVPYDSLNLLGLSLH